MEKNGEELQTKSKHLASGLRLSEESVTRYYEGLRSFKVFARHSRYDSAGGTHVLHELSGLEDRLKQLFHRVVHRKRREDLLSCSTFLPSANVYERSDKLLYVEVTGLDRKDLDVKLDGNVLSAHGERKFSRGVRNKVWIHVVRFGSKTVPGGSAKAGAG